MNPRVVARSANKTGAESSRGVENNAERRSAHRQVNSENTLARRAPAIARQWHPTKNGARTPHDVSVHRTGLVWWKCPAAADHEWRSAVRSRTRDRKRCPFCAGKRASSTYSLATHTPELARQWHPTKNGELRPDDVLPGAHKDAWWKCEAGPDHIWRAKVYARARMGTGCPFCSNSRVSVTNSLASARPELAGRRPDRG